MGDSKDQTRSFDTLLRESRQKRQAEQLAQEIFGKNRRPSADTKGSAANARQKPALGASLASRVGVAKRTSPLPRTNSNQGRSGRPSVQSRPSQRNTSDASNPPAATSVIERNATTLADGATTKHPEISIRGAAGGPVTLVAENFAPGTTAADIESVMTDVGGQLTDCHLVATHPTVIAEMTFVEKVGAQAVISTFDMKRADGRTLRVFVKPVQVEPEPQPTVVEPAAEEAMEVDHNAEARESENRLREERRSRVEQNLRDDIQSRPQADRGYYNDYARAPRYHDTGYQDGRYGQGSGLRYDGRGCYRDEGRMYTDNARRNGQSWRP